MRSIKFRAWNGKEMFYPFIARNLRIGKASWSLWEYDTIIATSDYDNNKLMQFTGLQDKDGVDIYEGDIIQFRIAAVTGNFSPPLSPPHTFEVINKNGCFKAGYKHFSRFSCYDKIEVMGNKFENPELLQEGI